MRVGVNIVGLSANVDLLFIIFPCISFKNALNFAVAREDLMLEEILKTDLVGIAALR